MDCQAVKHSKFNGGLFGSTKAAWIKTNKGVLEAVFFERTCDLERIQISEELDSNPGYRKYTVTVGNDKHSFEGRFPVYFTRYKAILIVTYDSNLNDAFNQLVADQTRSAQPRT